MESSEAVWVTVTEFEGHLLTSMTKETQKKHNVRIIRLGGGQYCVQIRVS